MYSSFSNKRYFLLNIIYTEKVKNLKNEFTNASIKNMFIFCVFVVPSIFLIVICNIYVSNIWKLTLNCEHSVNSLFHSKL